MLYFSERTKKKKEKRYKCRAQFVRLETSLLCKTSLVTRMFLDLNTIYKRVRRIIIMLLRSMFTHARALNFTAFAKSPITIIH